MTTKIVILVSGRGSNMKSIIEACKEGQLSAEVSLVISDKSKAPALDIAEEYNIETKIVTQDEDENRTSYCERLNEILKTCDPDIICLAGFMKIISGNIINDWQGKLINIHPSLLPKFKGLNAQKQFWNSKDAAKGECSGCTVHYVDSNVDSGEIILQNELKENKFSFRSYDEFCNALLKLEHQTYIKAIKQRIDELDTPQARFISYVTRQPMTYKLCYPQPMIDELGSTKSEPNFLLNQNPSLTQSIILKNTQTYQKISNKNRENPDRDNPDNLTITYEINSPVQIDT